jgi:hypothetical protein
MELPTIPNAASTLAESAELTVSIDCPKQSLQNAQVGRCCHSITRHQTMITYALCTAVPRRTVRYYRHTNHVLLYRESQRLASNSKDRQQKWMNSHRMATPAQRVQKEKH